MHLTDTWDRDNLGTRYPGRVTAWTAM